MTMAFLATFLLVLAASVSAAPALAADEPLVLYEDAVSPGFWDGSFGFISRNQCDTATKISGTCSYAIELESAGGLAIGKDGGFSTAGYTHLEFALNTMGQDIEANYLATLLTEPVNGGNIQEIFITDEDVVESLGGGWVRIAIPVSELNPQNSSILSVQIKNESPDALDTIYLDRIRFLVLAGGPPPGCESGFADVPDDDPACAAIAALSSQQIIRGYATTPPTFGPGDPVQRAQMAAFLVRGLDWQGRATGPRNFSDFGALVGELRTASLILANACEGNTCVASGYGDGRFGPTDRVTHAQVISFVARAFQLDPAYDWQPSGAAHPYSGVPAVHDADARTYHAAAGAIPQAPTTTAAWNQPAPRAWVAMVLYQALQSAP
jgi:hypothetical protein